MVRSSESGGAPSSFFAPRRSGVKAASNRKIHFNSSARVVSSTSRPCCPPTKLPLLQSGASWKSKIQFLTPNRSSWILHVPKFCCSYSKQQSSTKQNDSPLLFFQDVWKTHPEQQHSLVLFGRKVLENRYSAMYSKDETIGTYTYSGSSRSCQVCNSSQPHERFILALFAAADAIVGQLLSPTGSLPQPESRGTPNAPLQDSVPISTPIYNACLVNWYTPEHTIGLHSDDEAELDTSWPIFSLSWGGPRRFLLRPKSQLNEANQKLVHEVLLKDGDLLVMGGKCQEEFKHEIPKVRSTKDGLVGNRISWTIRRMRPTKKAAKAKARAREGTQHRQHNNNNDKGGGTKRTHHESTQISETAAIQSLNKPRKKATIYNPYARARG